MNPELLPPNCGVMRHESPDAEGNIDPNAQQRIARVALRLHAAIPEKKVLIIHSNAPRVVQTAQALAASLKEKKHKVALQEKPDLAMRIGRAQKLAEYVTEVNPDNMAFVLCIGHEPELGMLLGTGDNQVPCGRIFTRECTLTSSVIPPDCILMRHGDYKGNETDGNLTTDSIAYLKTVVVPSLTKHIKGEKLEIISSPLNRAIITASLIRRTLRDQGWWVDTAQERMLRLESGLILTENVFRNLRDKNFVKNGVPCLFITHNDIIKKSTGCGVEYCGTIGHHFETPGHE